MTGYSEEYTSQSMKGCRGEKRVSFPPDEEMVSDFVEIKTALQEADGLTLTDIILAYKQNCEKHHVKPSTKALDQLKQITCVSDRARYLDLSGEQLDYCSCESLEEILKSVQFDFISLQGAELEENGASSLLDMFLYYESATHLDVSSNSGMGFSGWLSLSHLLRQSGCLWRLDACNMPMVDYAAQALSKALLTSRLTVLHLENTCLSGKPLFTLVGALKRNAALQELYISDNNLNGYQDSMQLGDLLKYNSTLRSLDLSNNTISDTGLEEICDALSIQKAGLRMLILSNNHITHHGMIHLHNVLPCLKTLETLNLGNNNLENRGIHMLKESLMINRSLLQLGLASTGITCEGAVTLAEILAENLQIQRLDVRHNQVLAGGLMALSLALKINHSLIRLDLDQNVKEEKEEFLIETQKMLLSRISDLCVVNAVAAKGTALQPAPPSPPNCSETTSQPHPNS
ncbi:protein phosphatase 1 regulatory subunit 37-like [Myxocyprinus asiaticus]|uniref:protein phosphatase 1 regulatory subunit 37-like n=1 Tax=Myxocyprinus asiaticus TaxID=70543 RepID=UPI0022234737|nr:protein phosphatase 1 regulatory subunit 37-like [Myxocyprinus asiaticus]